MNFSQLHERLRLEVARRIHRGLLTGSSLAAQTGLQPSHISNFLRRKRKLSLSALDRVLIALSLNIDDLVPRILEGRSRGAAALADEAFDHIPLVSHAAAIHSPPITESVTLELIRVPAGALNDLRPRRAPARRGWQRFVAVRVGPDQALPMSPILLPQSIALLDRHYTSLIPYAPSQRNLYGVNASNALVFRYVSLDSRQVILRPHSLQHPIELLEIGDDDTPLNCIVGRVCMSISQL